MKTKNNWQARITTLGIRNLYQAEQRRNDVILRTLLNADTLFSDIDKLLIGRDRINVLERHIVYRIIMSKGSLSADDLHRDTGSALPDVMRALARLISLDIVERCGEEVRVTYGTTLHRLHEATTRIRQLLTLKNESTLNLRETEELICGLLLQ